jgi:hypothetical protein
MRNNMDRGERLSDKDQFDKLEEQFRDRLPKNWEDLSLTQKLDWFGHRITLDHRESLDKEAAKETGWLSDYQLERRRRREVQSKLGGWDEIPPKPGISKRVYIDPNELWTGRQPGDDGSGPKKT